MSMSLQDRARKSPFMFLRRVAIGVALLIVLLVMFHKFFHSPPIYAHQESYQKYDKNSDVYKIAIIADMDQSSKQDNKWVSIMLKGTLVRQANGIYTVQWSEEITYESTLNEAGRGMELSELVFFNKKLYTIDDRTGVVFELTPKGVAVPVWILMDGDGSKNKGFKGEWMTVKDGKMYVGSMGKEFVSPGTPPRYDPMWIKVIDLQGVVRHIDWTEKYQKLRAFSNTTSPGYLLHEAVGWNPVEKKWYFLPRRVSTEFYDEVLDEERCGNIALVADEDFQQVTLKTNFGPLIKTRGFASVKFIPGRENELLLLKTEEKGQINTYITVLDHDGHVLMPETEIPGNIKFEGVEFL